MEDLKRILQHVEKKECWIWEGYTHPSGYGRVKYQGTSKKAYKVIYKLLVGPIPKNHHLHHVCRNKSCVNPDHLNLVTIEQHNKIHAKERRKS